jgi:CheY-like chemotaxis protein
MYSVLIVDDEFGLAEMTAELLTMRGYRVATAINGKLGLAQIAHDRPDVVLVDVMMPVMSGPDLMRALHMNPTLRDLPVIMMSAIGRSAVPPDLRPHLAGFLQKPFTFDELMATLTVLLPAR